MNEAEQISEERRLRDIAAMDACLKHARDLLDSARSVFAAAHPNIAFHLALLSFEELGRRQLIGLQGVAARQPVPPAWMQKHTLEHNKKIFWCFFGQNLFAGKLTKERLDGLTDFANRLHSERMAGLYVGYEGDSLQIPSETISAEYCSAVIDAAAAQIALVEIETPRVPTQEEIQTQMWFLALSENPETRQFIYSANSLAKLEELGDARAWVLWLKEYFKTLEAQTKAFLETELARAQSPPQPGTRNKWKIRIRIISQSHQINPKVLTAWNKASDWIKLSGVSGKKNQILVEFLLKDNITVKSLWYTGWSMARYFVAALNLATGGFWWWRMADDVDSYYDELIDLDGPAKVGMGRSPSLRIDWGANRVLSDVDLRNVSLCFLALPRPDTEKHKPYNYYIGGLTFLSLNDVHWQCEIQAFGNFFESLKAMMEQTGELEAGAPVAPFADSQLREVFPQMQGSDHDRHDTVVRAFDKGDPSAVGVTLRDVAHMKLCCDAYFQRNIVNPMMIKLNAERRGRDAG